MSIRYGANEISDVYYGASVVTRVYYGATQVWPVDTPTPTPAPTDFNMFATWLQSQSQVLAYVQITTYDYTWPFTGAFTNVYFFNNMLGSEISNWNSSTYPIVYMRIRGQLESASVFESQNRYLLRINRDTGRSGSNVITTYHNIPGTGNYSDTRVFHILDFDRQRQLVLGDEAGEVDAVRDNSIDFHVTHGDMIDFGGVTVGQFFSDLDNGQNTFLLIGDHDWRPWS